MYTAVRSRIAGFMLVLIMEYVRVVKGKGCKYVVNNNLFSPVSYTHLTLPTIYSV